VDIFGLGVIRREVDTNISFNNARSSFVALAKEAQSQGLSTFFKSEKNLLAGFEKLVDFFSSIDQIIQYPVDMLFEPVYRIDWKPGTDVPILLDDLAKKAALASYKAHAMFKMSKDKELNPNSIKFEKSVEEIKLFTEENIYPLLDNDLRSELDNYEAISIAESLEKKNKGQGEVFLLEQALFSSGANIE
jgi:predicted transcriptional regulator